MAWLLAIIAILAIGGLVALSLKAPPQTPQIDLKQNAHGAQKRNTNSAQQHDAANNGPAVSDQNATADSKWKTNEDAYQRANEDTEFWTIFGRRLKITDTLLATFTFVLILVGIGQGIFLKRTDDGTHKAANAAHSSAESVKSAERASLLMETVKLYGVREIAADGNAREPEISYVLKNYGRSIAWTKTINVSLAANTEKFYLPETPDYSGGIATDMPYPVPQGAGYTSYKFASKLALTPDVAKKVIARGYLFVFGYVDYRDIFGDERQSRFCYWYHFGATEADDRIEACGTDAYWRQS